ncbi:unnamed protein product [Rotaria socialis]|uniref:Uncharacterized protein n=2 Tax=Rotaria socialis TaxID=392032 RepID=A0A817TD70_9BILA|nr:unnamed protein product [Rotaria socialis]
MDDLLEDICICENDNIENEQQATTTVTTTRTITNTSTSTLKIQKKKKAVKTDSSKTRCNACLKTFSIHCDGKTALDKHMNHVAHQTSMKTFEKSTLIKTLAVLASESDQISAAEGMIVYHEVKHGYSYISQACGTNLIKSLFESSSSVAKSLSCGKTKSRAIACNIFGPYFTKKRNCKTYPFTVQFFSDVGVKRVLIQFIEDPHETAEDIFKNACRVINDFQLKIEHLTSVSANNTNVNFGEHHSVFRLFKNEAPHIVQAVDLHRIIDGLIRKLQQRLRDKYFGNRTHDILRQLQEADANKAEEFKRSFESFIETVIEYIKSYYDDNTRKFYEKLSFFSYQSLEFLALERLMDVADLVKVNDLNKDELYSEYCELRVLYDNLIKTNVKLNDDNFFLQVDPLAAKESVTVAPRTTAAAASTN